MRVVFDFTITGGKSSRSAILADPTHLSQLDRIFDS